MAKVICAFRFAEGGENLGDAIDDAIFGSGIGLSQQGFEFGEDLFDGIEVGGIGRQEDKPRTGMADCGSDGVALMAAQIVDDHDVAGL